MNHEQKLMILDRMLNQHVQKKCWHGNVQPIGCNECVLDFVARLEELELPIPPLPEELR